MTRVCQLALATVLLSLTATAQIRIGGFAPAGASNFGRRPIGLAHSHRYSYPGYAYSGLPYFYSDYEPYEEYALEPPPRPEPAPQVKTEPAADPMLLELHGSQWVKVSNFSQGSDRTISTAVPAQQISSKPLPPALLVFRDGHTEEISSYSIIGQTIYAKADYWSTGKWTRTIQLADLNIPVTLEQNHERGVNFGLPSSPDEIMIRP
jgi:hypothetical protein